MAHILIVEDEPTNTEVASVICEAAGHTVAAVPDGQAALERLQQERFDLILLDVLMPVMDGITLTRKLRADPTFQALPIIGVTAKASNADQGEMKEAGMDQILLKPYRNKELLSAINTALVTTTAP